MTANRIKGVGVPSSNFGIPNEPEASKFLLGLFADLAARGVAPVGIANGWQFRLGRRAADLIVHRHAPEYPGQNGVPSPRDRTRWNMYTSMEYHHVQIVAMLLEITPDHTGSETWFPALKEPFTVWGTFGGNVGRSIITNKPKLLKWLKL